MFRLLVVVLLLHTSLSAELPQASSIQNNNFIESEESFLVGDAQIIELDLENSGISHQKKPSLNSLRTIVQSVQDRLKNKKNISIKDLTDKSTRIIICIRTAVRVVLLLYLGYECFVMIRGLAATLKDFGIRLTHSNVIKLIESLLGMPAQAPVVVNLPHSLQHSFECSNPSMLTDLLSRYSPAALYALMKGQPYYFNLLGCFTK